MQTYLISYDLGVPEGSSDYQRVIDYIQSYPNWATPLKSQWFVVSENKNAGEILNDLKSLTDSNDKILVMNVSGDYWTAARMSLKVTDWMKNNV